MSLCLQLLDFTSDRKRMSVVVRFPDGKIKMYMKGADNKVMKRLNADPNVNPPGLVKKTKKHLTKFSVEGLRVLVVAEKDIPQEEYEEWAERYRKASNTIGNRKQVIAQFHWYTGSRCCGADDYAAIQAMENLAEELEANMRLLGATAIEDKLQEGVPETISKLRRAGMKVWILTGDKRETAVNIGCVNCCLAPTDVVMCRHRGFMFCLTCPLYRKSCNLLDNLDLQYVSTGSSNPEPKKQEKGHMRRESTFNFTQFQSVRAPSGSVIQTVLTGENAPSPKIVRALTSRSGLGSVAEDSTEVLDQKDDGDDSDSQSGNRPKSPASAPQRQLTMKEEMQLKV